MDTPAQIDIVMVKRRSESERPDLPHYGAGETSCKPMIAAVANAIFDATGCAPPARAVQEGAGARRAQRRERVIYGFLETPVGRLLVARDPAGVRRFISMAAKAGPYGTQSASPLRLGAARPRLRDVATQLTEYFERAPWVRAAACAGRHPIPVARVERAARNSYGETIPTVSSRRASAIVARRARSVWPTAATRCRS
jgi:hypothetical protein